jgi:hypothetical protein
MMRLTGQLSLAMNGEAVARMKRRRETNRFVPEQLTRMLTSKGFGGGVPLNTETTTVKHLWLRMLQP